MRISLSLLEDQLHHLCNISIWNGNDDMLIGIENMLSEMLRQYRESGPEIVLLLVEDKDDNSETI